MVGELNGKVPFGIRGFIYGHPKNVGIKSKGLSHIAYISRDTFL